MNPTTTLLGATGLLLVVALLFSVGNLNKERGASKEEIAALRREIQQLSVERARLRSNNLTYLSTSNFSVPSATETKPANDSLEELERYRQEAERLRQELANAQEVVETEPVAEETVEADTTLVSQSDTGKRARLINQAILQGNIQEWDGEFGMAVVEPTPASNFKVGDQLGLRRNGGILCKIRIDRAVQGQYIATIIQAPGGGIPELSVGDELIIPPVFDGQLDY